MKKFVQNEFESAFAEWLGVTRAFAFWKGRVALYAVLKAMGISEGDEVAVPGYTCVANITPIHYLGAIPKYVDILPDTYNMNPRALEEAITSRTKAIIAQHTYGIPADLDEIIRISKKHGVPVLEDCCLALGTRLNGKRVGSFTAASYFSFQWSKTIRIGLGGMLAINDRSLVDKIEALRNQSMFSPGMLESTLLSAQMLAYGLLYRPSTAMFLEDFFRFLTNHGLVVGSYSLKEYDGSAPPHFLKGMNRVQGLIGRLRFREIDTVISHRRMLQTIYEEYLQKLNWPVLDDSVDSQTVLVRYPIRVKRKFQTLDDAYRDHIELGSWFDSPLHPRGTPLERYGYVNGTCPEAEQAAREVVNLPLHMRITPKHAETIVKWLVENAVPANSAISMAGQSHQLRTYKLSQEWMHEIEDQV
ncbi:DegT/DnrJ/EryC1/StrS family aminotransferase [Desulfomonile tiedjei]|uniref:Putative PLP-dependent enzyme possibly involved in cell wall biogenesis n=1 Tax=Desulfomonile tiedjei (strain ATCC 49306 / DSM 6799 / DCB-1) TaxID=706587 RepID=I4CBJ9_DESTA|nr:DegT/DnrJ/EryC1/StrS family aminotransferase [Desulfomonile tiedjei]AFM26940.1 putative PLP-dependent enzyme possibly involved in cell wall biogenesis [Desulfomonile tiedjei DSM 6799]